MKAPYRLSVILLCLWFSSYISAAMSIEVTPKKIRVGESFRITLTSDDTTRSAPDLTPLQKDFTILGREHSISYTVINGQARSMSQWSIVLSANKAGTLVIPPLKYGQMTSPVSQIQVIAQTTPSTTVASPSATPTSTITINNPVMLTSEVDQANPYINEQVIYTVRLLSRSNLLNAQYHPPRVKDAIIVALGKGRQYQRLIQHHTYDVEEQQYAIFPQKSGELTINPPQLSGLIYSDMPHPFAISAKPRILNVKTMPAEQGITEWLPAQKISLDEEFDHKKKELLQGITMVRTLHLEAYGAPGQLLPIPKFLSAKMYSVYPDKPQVNTLAQQQAVIGTVTLKVTYLLNTPGDIEIPAISIPWFDTKARKIRIASLPAHTFHIVAKRAVTASKLSTFVPPAKASVYLPKPANLTLIGWVIGGAVLGSCIVLGMLWLIARLWQKRREHTLVLQRLKAACLTNHPQMARDYLLQWAQHRWPSSPPLHLHGIIALVNDAEVKQQIHLLIFALYHPETKQVWHGMSLWHNLKRYLTEQRSVRVRKSLLPPLNP